MAAQLNTRPPDDKLTTLIAHLPASSTYFSLEFFPPKTQAGFNNLQARLSRMTAAFKPLFVTVTWGAGGSTSTKSLELAEICQRQMGVPTVLHLTCTNMSQKVVDEALEACRAVGVRNILALRGDPPREEYRDLTPEGQQQEEDEVAAGEEFVWAVDLVRYIRRRYGDFFCVGVAGYPEGHADESHPEAGKQSVDHDLPYLAEKVKAGADFIMTQLTYDAEAYARYESRLRDYVDNQTNQKVFASIPIIPGLMPIQSYQTIRRLTKLSHATLPKDINDRIEAVKQNDEEVKKVGVEIIAEIVEKIRASPQPEGLPRGLHFYTLNLEKSVAFILDRCKLLPPPKEVETDSSEESDVAVIDGPSTNGHTVTSIAERRHRRTSSINAQPHNRVILDRAKKAAQPQTNGTSCISSASAKHETDSAGSGVPAGKPSRSDTQMISSGAGSLGREATWDDFPNGRWGPSHSPAFGEIDGYGPSLKVGPITARKLWGHPKSRSDITDLFTRHVTGSLHSVPWSDDVDTDGISNTGQGALRAETDMIRRELLALIEQKGYWTLASQPAVDGVKSDHPVFGWGPPGEGFVFQKAFVEFFCPAESWPRLHERLTSAPATDISWMALMHDGTFTSSDCSSSSGSSSNNKNNKHKTSRSDNNRTSNTTTTTLNAVTWGVFRGKEIVTPTIIEAESFRAWGDEAFQIWAEWRRCFPRGSEEEICLETCRRGSVLVNVVGQRFVGGEGRGLWDLLLAD